jgi:spore coat protein U-like protein
MSYLGRILVGLFAVILCPISWAGTATGTLSVTANVVDTCTVAASGNLLAFGAYTGALNNTNGSLSLTCTDGDTYTVALNIGTGSGASFTGRILTNPSPAGTLTYNIYTTAGRTTVWGDGTGATATVPGTGTGALQTLTVFGQIPAGQTATVTPGNYTDTVTITVTFTP